MRGIIARILFNIITAVVGSALALEFTGTFFHIPLRGSLLKYIVLMGCFMIALIGPACLFAGLMNRFEHFCEFLSFTNIIIFCTAGLVWPIYMMPGYLVSVVKFLWPMIYVLMPLRALNVKGMEWNVMLPDIQGILLYTLFWLPVGIYIYVKKVNAFKTTSPLTETI